MTNVLCSAKCVTSQSCFYSRCAGTNENLYEKGPEKTESQGQGHSQVPRTLCMFSLRKYIYFYKGFNYSCLNLKGATVRRRRERLVRGPGRRNLTFSGTPHSFKVYQDFNCLCCIVAVGTVTFCRSGTETGTVI